MTDFPIDPHGNDWSLKAMADRLDNIGSLSDDDAATLDRIALELRAASVVAPVPEAVAQPVTVRLMVDMPDFRAIGRVVERVQAVQDTAKAEGWPMDKYRSAIAAALEPVPEVFRAGPMTMDRVFKPAGLTNLSDMQAFLDAVEKALARV